MRSLIAALVLVLASLVPSVANAGVRVSVFTPRRVVVRQRVAPVRVRVQRIVPLGVPARPLFVSPVVVDPFFVQPVQPFVVAPFGGCF